MNFIYLISYIYLIAQKICNFINDKQWILRINKANRKILRKWLKLQEKIKSRLWMDHERGILLCHSCQCLWLIVESSFHFIFHMESLQFCWCSFHSIAKFVKFFQPDFQDYPGTPLTAIFFQDSEDSCVPFSHPSPEYYKNLYVI